MSARGPAGADQPITLHRGGSSVPLQPGGTVLEALEHAGIEVASGCRAGTCCKCMLQADDPPAEAQRGLRPTLQAQGYFLACQARPTSDLHLIGDAAPAALGAVVRQIDRVAPGVARILLRPESPIDYAPGQYLGVAHPDGPERSYSIASLPATGELELHVRQVPNGLVSTWLHGRSPGDEVRIRGPFGQCFYVDDDLDKKHLLVGAGTGLAPLLGIARDAHSRGHRGKVILVHGGLQPDRLYLRDELRRLAEGWPQLEVHHCVLRGSTESEHEGPLDQVAIGLAGSLQDARSFLCGDGGLVRQLQRSLFLAGAPSAEILADPFLPAPA